MNIDTISGEAYPLTTCPAFVMDTDDLPIECGEDLALIATSTLIGDDYGSWRVYGIEFRCGHTIHDMLTSLRHADQI